MEFKQNSKANSKKTNLIQEKAMKRSNTSSSVKKKKKNNPNPVKKPSSKNDSMRDCEQYAEVNSLEIEGVQLKTPREEQEDSCQDIKSEIVSEKDVKDGTSDLGDVRENDSQDNDSETVKAKSLSSISLEETVSTALSQVSLKPKNNTSKVNKTKGNNSRIYNNTQQQGARNNKQLKSNSQTSILTSSSNSRLKNESLRWENECEDEDLEEERIRVYKINRRKRYLAAAQAKGLGWVANYASNGSPMSEDSGIEMREREKNLYSLKDTHKSVNDYSTLKTLGPAHSGLNSGVTVEC